MTVEEHAAALLALEQASHDEFVAKIQGWVESAEAAGDELRAQRHREHLSRLAAIPKPWERARKAA
ncbi:hypothetical protein ACFQZ4_52580 [Catellatospora coxensis]|uniref:Uncharacterized protein n=1 Tax=Catellatospora coxensis TaxID=310354 RepID=A0A8J3LAR6_9ACTN|nr:hypothetical protein [Catellatospora coxensis]GIG11616.1 hypothetical protein Cco03nite_83160 [Catellatospora coxensis]